MIEVVFEGSGYYAPSKTLNNLTVNKFPSVINLTSEDVYVGSDVTIKAEVTDGVTGEIIFIVNNKEYPVLIKDNINNINELRKLNVNRCIGCGICSYICPAKINLREYVESKKSVPVSSDTKEKSKENAEKIQMQIGMKIVIKLGKKLHEVRDDLVKFVANYKEISEEEAKKVDIKDIVKELISDKDFVSFFKQKVMSE